MKSEIIFGRVRRASACLIAGLVTAVLLVGSIAQAAHVESSRLLPRKTLAYVQVPCVPGLLAAFQMTNVGRMIADPQVQPFVTGLFQAADSALVKVKEVTGLSLAEIAAIPQGEITLAFIPLDDIPDADPVGFVGMVDCGDNIVAARKFADTIHQAMEKDGFSGREETVDEFKISIYQHGDSGRSPFVLVERENTMVVCSNVTAAKQILARWVDGHEDCLAQNRKFTSIMDRCRGTKDEEPHIKFYADPIAIAYQATKGNPAAQLGMAILPTLGLDGLKAVGGSFVFATEDFDGIFHLHVQLGIPRNGLLDLIALESGDDTPPRWVPADVTGYTSGHWNFDQTYTKGTKLWDTFQGQGAGAGILNGRCQQILGLDLEKEVLPAITGRMIDVNWFERPIKLGVGAQSLVGIQLRDPTAFAESFNKMVAHFGDSCERKNLSGVTYYQFGTQRDKDDPRPLPCFALWQDWLIASDRPGIMEHILSQGDTAESTLATALEYKLIASKISQQPGGDRPGMFSFVRAEEDWKYLYDLAASDQTRDLLKDRSTKNPDNPFFTALNQGLTQNPLPPWEVISRYLAPEGSMLTEDQAGIHYMRFALRRK